jgi:hypothetical protein
MEEIPKYEIILSHPLKYPRSKQSLNLSTPACVTDKHVHVTLVSGTLGQHGGAPLSSAAPTPTDREVVVLIYIPLETAETLSGRGISDQHSGFTTTRCHMLTCIATRRYHPTTLSASDKNASSYRISCSPGKGYTEEK